MLSTIMIRLINNKKKKFSVGLIMFNDSLIYNNNDDINKLNHKLNYLVNNVKEVVNRLIRIHSVQLLILVNSNTNQNVTYESYIKIFFKDHLANYIDIFIMNNMEFNIKYQNNLDI